MALDGINGLQGDLTGGKIVIKDKTAGFTERQIDFVVTNNGKIAIAE